MRTLFSLTRELCSNSSFIFLEKILYKEKMGCNDAALFSVSQETMQKDALFQKKNGFYKFSRTQGYVAEEPMLCEREEKESRCVCVCVSV